MVLFKSFAGWVANGSGSLSDKPQPQSFHSMLARLVAREQTLARWMLASIAFLVLLPHLWVVDRMQNPPETVAPKKPKVIAVALIKPPEPVQPVIKPPEPKLEPIKPPPVAPKPISAPKPLPVQKKPVAPPAPIKLKPQPVQQPLPVVDKPEATDFQVHNPDAKESEKTQANTNNIVPYPNAITAPAQNSGEDAEKFTAANFKANYATNPAPDYPGSAKERGWEGKVLLKVEVSADGMSGNISVHKSSGHDVLDEAAVEAVKRWKFIPAKRGDTPVASTVIVPIVFKLDAE